MATIPTKKISELTTKTDTPTIETYVPVAEKTGTTFATKKFDLQNVYAELNNKLGKTEKAVDADKLDGNDSSYFATAANLSAHTTNTNNPHNVTAAQLGSLRNIVEDTTPELGGELNAGLHSIGFTEKVNTSSNGAVTIDWKTSNKQTITLTENTAFTFVNPSNPCNLLLRIVQDATGGWAVTMPPLKTPGGTALTFSTAANAEDILILYFDGTNYIATILQDVK